MMFQLPKSFPPIIFGPITVIAKSQVTGQGIDNVCFIIDKEKILDNDPPWEFKWKKPSFGRKLIEVEAYKGDKMIGRDKLEVWKFL